MENIKTLLNYYTKLAQRYSHNDAIKSLKKQYVDICSHGDVIINDLIDILNNQINNNNIEKNILDYRNKFIDSQYFDSVVKHLNDTIENFYKDGLHPDPFWAS